jgi:ribonuclease D
LQQNQLFEITLPQFAVEDIDGEMLHAARKMGVLACDLETSGLDWKSEKIGLCQVYVPGHSTALIQPHTKKVPKNFVRLMSDRNVNKLFHHAMFDLRFLAYHWGVKASSVRCTKIASKLLNPERKDHSLATLVNEHFGIALDKGKSRKSDWLSWELNNEQIDYAKRDVIYLPALFDSLYGRLKSCGRSELADHCFAHLATRTELEIAGFGDVFSY